MRGLALECAIDLAETALLLGRFPDEEDLRLDYLARKRREQRRIAAQDARLIARIRRQRKETRLCPVCGKPFPVLVHGKSGGRPREYCSDRCQKTSEMRRRRERAREVGDAT